MIKSLKIFNFRCFRTTKFSGFNQINLIGGHNNAGKTALLEALFVNLSPRANAILALRRFRRESLEFAKNMPERAWSNLFFNQNTHQPLQLVSYEENDAKYHHIEMSCDASLGQFNEVFKEEPADDDLVDLRNLLSERDYTRSTLHIHLINGNKKRQLSSLVAHSKGMITKDLKLPDERKANYIPASMRLSSSALAREYDKADIKGHAANLLKAIQVIDKSIAEIKTFNIGEPSVYLRRQGGEYLPIYLYGEAVSKATDFILRMINDPNSVLLIDEIENGIHHANQYDLWKIIFALSSICNVQIFATTHSREMIQAFADAGLSDTASEDKASYFEITQSIKSGELIGIRRDLETLTYEMTQGMGVRGE